MRWASARSATWGPASRWRSKIGRWHEGRSAGSRCRVPSGSSVSPSVACNPRRRRCSASSRRSPCWCCSRRGRDRPRSRGRTGGMPEHESTAAAMRRAATELLSHLDEEQRAAAGLPFTDDHARRWIEYRPRPRPGVCLADLDRTARKAAHRLLHSGLSPHAFAQAEAIMVLEEVLDRIEGGHRGRHGNDYWVVVFGDPVPGGRWSWRFEGHHLSVTMTVAGELVSPAPVFFGANPATVSYAGRPVLRPLAPEEDLAWALLDAIGPATREQAIVAGTAPEDLVSNTRPRVDERAVPLGVPAHRLRAAGRGRTGAGGQPPRRPQQQAGGLPPGGRGVRPERVVDAGDRAQVDGAGPGGKAPPGRGEPGHLLQDRLPVQLEQATGEHQLPHHGDDEDRRGLFGGLHQRADQQTQRGAGQRDQGHRDHDLDQRRVDPPPP